MEKMDQNKIPKRKLYTGEEIPAVGLGTFGSDKYGPEAISEAVYGAVKFGYRLIDCAAVYQNEAQIGQVLKRLFDEGVVERKDLFITSKVWNDMHEKVGASCRQSLQGPRDLRRSTCFSSTGRFRTTMHRAAAAIPETRIQSPFLWRSS